MVSVTDRIKEVAEYLTAHALPSPPLRNYFFRKGYQCSDWEYCQGINSISSREHFYFKFLGMFKKHDKILKNNKKGKFLYIVLLIVKYNIARGFICLFLRYDSNPGWKIQKNYLAENFYKNKFIPGQGIFLANLPPE